MNEYGDYDSILCVINQNIKPFKKKNLHYLLMKYRDIVEFNDIIASNKCLNCRQARPWFIVKNQGRGIFVVQKILDFFTPWFSLYLQKRMNLVEFTEDSTVDLIYLLITQIDGRGASLKQFYVRIREDVIDEDIRFKNGCFAHENECNGNNLWLILRKNSRTINVLKKYQYELNPWLLIKGQIPLFKEMLPKQIIGLKQWTKKLELDLGHLKVQMDN